MFQRMVVACLVTVAVSMALPPPLAARPRENPAQQLLLVEPLVHVDRIGQTDGETPSRLANADTIWVADWSFEGRYGGCDDSGWQRVDNHRMQNADVYWTVDASFDGTGAVRGKAAVLGADSPCWEQPGYCNDWYQGIRILYRGGTREGRFAAELSFDYVLDAEPEFDFLLVEADSACASSESVDLRAHPSLRARAHRSTLFVDEVGLNTNGHVETLELPNFSNPDVEHCLYIGFFSDAVFAPCDGLQETTLGAAMVVDNVRIMGELTLFEDFEGPLDPAITFVNMHDDAVFGTWGRLYKHVTDNDPCTENTSCSWLWTDHTTPLVANDAAMAFGPTSYVVRNWLDESIVSPWVSLASTPDASATILQFRRFPGNNFSTSRIVANWSVRGKKNVDGEPCISAWGHASQWNSLSHFAWITPSSLWGSGYDMSADFDPASDAIQIRHRVMDWQLISGADPPAIHAPGPGPYTGRTRIGRVIQRGPRVSYHPSYQAQDAFPDELNPHYNPATGERFRPTTNRFGTAAFSRTSEIDRHPVQPIVGDSLLVEVNDVRETGGITHLGWYGAIVAGPHRGKAPPPHTVGANGLFMVTPAPALTDGGQHVEDWYFVDLDDFYLRGGDVVHYFWLAADAHGGWTSSPPGLGRVPDSIEEAQAATNGLFEVSILPTIQWDEGYLLRIAADPSGKLEPTDDELAGSQQAHRILYTQAVNAERRTGDVNRTSFMYTLDRLGYRGSYDVYDHTAYHYSSYNQNHVGSRATVEQATGYALIIYDAGVRSYSVLPDGVRRQEGSAVDQLGWYQRWLERAVQSEAGQATLWVLGEQILQGSESVGSHSFYSDNLGVSLVADSQTMNLNPDVEGQGRVTLAGEAGACEVDFTGHGYTLTGACPVQRNFDALGSTGTAVVTHAYVDPSSGASGSAAIVMNSNVVQKWNTIVQSHPWFDMHDRDVSGGGDPRDALVDAVFRCVLPSDVLPDPNPTDVPDDSTQPNMDAAPAVTALHANAPNPFNPATVLRFDLARAGHVDLRLYDVSGRLVRTLVDEAMPADRHAVTWDGTDDAGRPVPSGVLMYRLSAPGYDATRKMVLVR